MFQHDDGWSCYLDKHGDTLSDWTKLAVERMLACGTCLMGVRCYCCASLDCTHARFFCQSCKSKACSSCGRFSTITGHCSMICSAVHAGRQGIEVDIFCALYTYGRRLNRYPHIHVSVTRGGLDVKYSAKWRLNRSLFGIRIDHDLACISDRDLASQSITVWHASDQGLA
ncbi:transposase, partial [Serratia sp. N21D137]|uniref:transposase n=1 Tax=Serratia sp. N21D137 TaxID=3397495 RepID=UPI0039E1F188